MKKPKEISAALAAGVLLAAAIAAGTAVRGGEESPPAPLQREISGFTRYIPDEEGNVHWRINGSHARFLTPTLVEVEGFTAEAHGDLAPLTIATRSLVFDLETNIGRAEEEWAESRRGDMFLRGRGVVWDSGNRRIRFIEDVRFVIRESGGGGLFPL